MKVVDAAKLEELAKEWEKALGGYGVESFHAEDLRSLILSTAREEGGALREALKHTPGPWVVRCIRDSPDEPPTVETMKRVLCEGIDRTIAHGDADADLWAVLSSTDKADPVFICYTGNGPTSEANARFIAALAASEKGGEE